MTPEKNSNCIYIYLKNVQWVPRCVYMETLKCLGQGWPTFVYRFTFYVVYCFTRNPTALFRLVSRAIDQNWFPDQLVGHPCSRHLSVSIQTHRYLYFSKSYIRSYSTKWFDLCRFLFLFLIFILKIIIINIIILLLNFLKVFYIYNYVQISLKNFLDILIFRNLLLYKT